MTWLSTLRAYQRQGAEFLAQPHKAIRARVLALNVGYGKTRCNLAFARFRHENGDAQYQPIIVIAPSIARKDWKREAAKFWPELPVTIVGIDDVKKSARPLRDILNTNEPHLVVSSYESAHYIHEAAPQLLGTFIADEAHRAKRESTLRAQVTRSLLARAERSSLSTGTPIHNRPIDLHQLLDMCQLGKFGSKWTLARKYFQIHAAKGGHGYTIGKLLDKEGLRRDTSHLIFTVDERTAYGELPARIHKLVPIEPDTKRAVRAVQALDLTDRKRGNALLRTLGKQKIPHVVELALELDEPLVIFVYQPETAAEISNRLLREGATCIVASGRSTADRRDKYIEQWKNGEARILICTMDAVNESATLTRASAMIFGDLDWLPGKMLQCAGRIDPARQPENERRMVRYYWVVLDGGLDEIVAERCLEKIDDAQGVLGTRDERLAQLRSTLAPVAERIEESEEAVFADIVARINARAERLEGLL